MTQNYTECINLLKNVNYIASCYCRISIIYIVINKIT